MSIETDLHAIAVALERIADSLSADKERRAPTRTAKKSNGKAGEPKTSPVVEMPKRERGATKNPTELTEDQAGQIRKTLYAARKAGLDPKTLLQEVDAKNVTDVAPDRVEELLVKTAARMANQPEGAA